jgi:prevent-host-death family protein
MAHRARPVVNIAAAKARLPELVRRAAAGEEIVIARDNRPVARLAPLAPPAARRAGSARGQVVLAPDFDATPKDFEGYLE